MPAIKTTDQQLELLRTEMERQGITQAELARRLSRTPQHINRVLAGRTQTSELDYWAFILGMEFELKLRPIE